MSIQVEFERTYGHHSATAGTGNEDLGSIRFVLADSPLDHVGNGVAVSSTLVAKRRLAANIPASTLMRGRWVDDNEAILLRQRLVRAASVVCLR